MQSILPLKFCLWRAGGEGSPRRCRGRGRGRRLSPGPLLTGQWVFRAKWVACQAKCTRHREKNKIALSDIKNIAITLAPTKLDIDLLLKRDCSKGNKRQVYCGNLAKKQKVFKNTLMHIDQDKLSRKSLLCRSATLTLLYLRTQKNPSTLYGTSAFFACYKNISPFCRYRASVLECRGKPFKLNQQIAFCYKIR